MTSARVLVPIAVTHAMFQSGTVAEPSGGTFTEWRGLSGDYYTVNAIRGRSNLNRLYKCIQAHTVSSDGPPPEADPTRWEDLGPSAGRLEREWASDWPYRVGDVCIRAGTHRVYECVRAHSGSSIGPPETAVAGYWQDIGPTNRWRAFDDYNTTAAIADGTLQYVLRPKQFCNGISVWLPAGDTGTISVKDAPGGSVIASKTSDLYEQAAGFYEFLFAPLPRVQKISIDNIPLAADPEITITIQAASGSRAGVGRILVGDWRTFLGNGTWGGTEFGASSSRRSYTYREYNEDGTLKRVVPRGNSRDVRASVVIPAEESMYADALLAEIIDTAVEFEASDMLRYGYLNCVGYVTGEMRPDNYSVSRIDLNVKGLI